MTGSNNVNVGSECLCGCILRLGGTTRSITASAQTCKGISYWLLKVIFFTTLIACFLTCIVLIIFFKQSFF